MENTEGTTQIAKDPICGMTVDPKKAAATVVYEGQPYYFCSKGCAAKFQPNPKQFVAAATTEASLQDSNASPANSRQANMIATNSQRANASAAKFQNNQQSEAGKAGVRYTCPMHPQI